MNKDNAHLYLPLVQALADGKLQFNGGDQEDPDWQDIQVVNWTEDPEKYRIKPASFPPKPEGMEWHNPDGLTAEQVGDGWRLLVESEVDGRFATPEKRDIGFTEMWHSAGERWVDDAPAGLFAGDICVTYRVPISTPFPNGQFIQDGKLVTTWKPKFKVGDRVRQVGSEAAWEVRGIKNEGYELYRLLHEGYSTCWRTDEQLEPAPWSLSRHIPGFRPLRDGEEWHREDWTEEMLPEGWRPLILGIDKGDYEVSYDKGSTWSAGGNTEARVLSDDCAFMRTRRPLPEPKKQVPLGLSDWLKDGPWWVRSGESDNNPMLVVDANGSCIRFGQDTCYNIIDSMSLERSNDGITWSLCSKPA